ncbi:MAG: mandelate racemase/muconate lactonizing enzyme family protein [Chloroflexota bacterium]|nr:mandelate racemase/muconate lactonizing enzyme family protein [Chloroflexota bacterium]
MKISRVEASYLANVPTTPPPYRKEPSKGNMMVLEIETEDGLLGYAPGGVLATPTTVGFINKQMAPALIGQDPLLIERIWNELTLRFMPRAYSSVWVGALSAIDIALWDIRGKCFNQPVWKLLGGARSKIPAYATFGLPPIYPLEELVAEAKYFASQGYERFKVNVGRFTHTQGPDEDASRVKALREALGDRAQIMMDSFCHMSGPEALRLCKLSEPYNVTFFEEPVYNDDAKVMADLRKRTSVPLASGQTHQWSYVQLLMNDAVDYLQPNVANDGGYTAGLKIAAMAQAFNIPIAHGNGSGPTNLHLYAGVANGGVLELHYINWMVYEGVFKSVPKPLNGWVEAPEASGVGLEPKEGIIREHRQEAT